MGDVDGADMLMSDYSNNRKSLMVWKNDVPYHTEEADQCICVVCSHCENEIVPEMNGNSVR